MACAGQPLAHAKPKNERGMSATTISAAQVKELRDLTGAGIMECKRALTESGGDVKKAEAIIVQ